MSILGRQVLIIEDAPDQRMLARKILETIGMMVTEAASVDEAFSILSKTKPDLILLDLKMPVKSGFVFLENKDRMTSSPLVPIIVTSSLHDKESVYLAISLGASDYIIKPLGAAKLIQKLGKYFPDTKFESHPVKIDEAPNLQISTESHITKIFVVDTDPAFQSLIESTLNEYDLQIEFFSSSEALLKRLSKQTPSLFIIDLNLESLNKNYELLQTIRTKHSQTTPIFVISTTTDLKVIAHAVEIGATEYLFKPLTESTLITKIVTHLNLL